VEDTETRVDEAWVVGDRDEDPSSFRGPADPLWRRAPLLLLRYPGILVAILLTTLLLAVAGASAPLFVSSASAAALEQELAAVSPTRAGLTVVAFGPIEGAALREHDGLLSSRAERIRELGARVLSGIGSQANVGTPDGAFARGRLATRTGFVEHLEVVERAPGDGVWISDAMAEETGLTAGDPVTIGVREATTETRIVGVYVSLAGDTEQGLPPLADYWVPLSEFVRSAPPHPPPPPLVLAEPSLFAQIGERLADDARYQWELPLDAGPLTLARAEGVAREIIGVQTDLDDPSHELGQALPFATETTELPQLVLRARQATAGLRGPVETVSWAGRIVALAAVAAAGVYAVQRRRVETRLLSARGVSPAATGGRLALEAGLPVAAGSVAGWGLAIALVLWLGPADLLDPAATRSAAAAVILTAAAALLLLWGATAAVVRRQLETGTGRNQVSRVPWEAVVLALAAAAFLEIVLRGSAVVPGAEGVPDVDVLVLMFPILLVAGGAGLIGKGLRRALPVLRTGGARLGSASYLAIRRLASLGGPVVTLLTATSLAFGVLFYAGILVASTSATNDAKAHVFTGSDLAAWLPPNPSPLPDLPFPATTVIRIPQAELAPSARPVEILGVDPATFDRAAYWDATFGHRSASEAIEPLGPAEGVLLPVLVAGGSLPEATDVDIGSARLDLRVVGTAEAFPGMTTGRVLLVARDDALNAALEAADSSLSRVGHELQVWAKGEPVDVERGLRSTGIPFEQFLSADTVERVPTFLSVSWTFEFLQALGVLTGLVALAGIVLYLQARQRSRTVAYALTVRMGLSRAAHRRSVGLELGGMIGAALAIGGGLAWLAAALVIGRLDLLPEVPPSPVLRFPLGLALTTLAAGALVAWLGALQVQRSADRANVAEVMRVDG